MNKLVANTFIPRPDHGGFIDAQPDRTLYLGWGNSKHPETGAPVRDPVTGKTMHVNGPIWNVRPGMTLRVQAPVADGTWQLRTSDVVEAMGRPDPTPASGSVPSRGGGMITPPANARIEYLDVKVASDLQPGLHFFDLVNIVPQPGRLPDKMLGSARVYLQVVQ